MLRALPDFVVYEGMFGRVKGTKLRVMLELRKLVDPIGYERAHIQLCE